MKIFLESLYWLQMTLIAFLISLVVGSFYAYAASVNGQSIDDRVITEQEKVHARY